MTCCNYYIDQIEYPIPLPTLPRPSPHSLSPHSLSPHSLSPHSISPLLPSLRGQGVCDIAKFSLALSLLDANLGVPSGLTFCPSFSLFTSLGDILSSFFLVSLGAALHSRRLMRARAYSDNLESLFRLQKHGFIRSFVCEDGEKRRSEFCTACAVLLSRETLVQ